MTDEYRYGCFIAGYGRARWMRMTLAARFRRWKRRRKVDDLAGLIGRWGV